jgi:hypothetical protein
LADARLVKALELWRLQKTMMSIDLIG